MQQPKFKFGDKVQFKTGSPVSFVVKVIRHDGEGYLYSSVGGFGSNLEEDLEPYQEPQKKKLYAYADGCSVTFQQSDRGERLRDNYGTYLRAPEYDIEYPESR